jgi:hypothetical protein
VSEHLAQGCNACPKWRPGRESNPVPPGCEPGALSSRPLRLIYNEHIGGHPGESPDPDPTSGPKGVQLWTDSYVFIRLLKFDRSIDAVSFAQEFLALSLKSLGV